jgi:glycosyltransferase involved in cell wall biosynthesis
MKDAYSLNLSVIIPTFDRAQDLRRCLQSVMAQSVPPDAGVEILVVSDGGTPEIETVCREFHAAPFSLRYERLPKRGPAAARNWAIDHSSGGILLFLNDDVALEPNHFAEHLRAHAQRPGHAVRGNTRWHPDVLRTPFMQWVAQTSLFYHLITDPMDIGYEYFHTLDLSIDRRWLREDRFSEDFLEPSLEDTELGVRLAKKGLKMAFNPRAFSYHYHYYEPEGFLRKARMNGRSAALLVAKHPELYERMVGAFLRTPQWQKCLSLAWLRLRGLRNSSSYWSTLYDYHYASAIHDHARRKESP